MFWLLLNIALAALALAKCYEPSPAYHPPNYDRNDAILKYAFARIKADLEIVVTPPEFAPTSFSVEITSSEETLWSNYHTARKRNASRPDIPEVNGDALYRIASISKTFTVLGILYQHEAGNLSLDDPVTKYIEEFNEPQHANLPWKDITLRTLASQLSGIPREFAQGDFYNADKWGLPNPVELGFPPVSPKGLIACDEYSPSYEVPCTASDLLESLKSHQPLFAPKQKSTYSNVAFEILGIVISRVTNQTYESYIADAIFEPLDMKKSSLLTPPDSAGVIPLNPQYWDVDEGIQNPTGGIYSSSTDLSKYIRYILKHYNGLSTAVNWLHPVSPSRGLNNFYGLPWEIFQTDRILEKSKRVISFKTKSGGLPGYNSIIMAVPEFDLGITILLAGPAAIFFRFMETITTHIVRAADEIATRELRERYVGTYASSDPGLNSSLTLVADHRGLVVTEFISNSTDFLNSEAMKYYGRRPGDKWYAQLVPTLLYVDEEEQTGEQWRLQGIPVRDEGERSIWDDYCVEDYDRPLYVGLPANEAVFWDDGENGFEKVELTGFRVNLTRVIKDEEFPSQRSPQEVMEL